MWITPQCRNTIRPVVKILHQDLGMRKLIIKWVPHLLTIDQKLQRVPDSMIRLGHFKRNPSHFLCRSVTINETWIHHNTPKRTKTDTIIG